MLPNCDALAQLLVISARYFSTTSEQAIGCDEEGAARQGSARDARQESASVRVRMQRCNTHLLVAACLSACARLATVNDLHTTGAAIDAGCDEEGGNCPTGGDVVMYIDVDRHDSSVLSVSVGGRPCEVLAGGAQGHEPAIFGKLRQRQTPAILHKPLGPQGAEG